MVWKNPSDMVKFWKTDSQGLVKKKGSSFHSE